MMSRKWLLVFILIFQELTAFSQQVVHGFVVDAQSRVPLGFAAIRVNRTGEFIMSDASGQFLVWTKFGDTVSVTVTHIGYQPATIVLGKGRPGLVRLLPGNTDLRSVTIQSSASPLYSTHLLGALDLNMRPARSAQDLLRLVPGLFIAQHQGGGKAEQIFLRGFDCDHGTDVNISVDGMPVNMVSHAHGQGYADLHFLIPEILSGFDWGKGPYYTSKGDLNTAGFVAYHTMDMLDRNFVKVEGGQFTTGRIVGALNLLGDLDRDLGRSFYVAGEALYSNGGPFEMPEHFTRFNLFGKFISPISLKTKLSLSLSTLSSQWRASGEIPNRALSEGYISSRFGVLDSAQGGFTSRTNAILQLNTNLGKDVTWENMAFYSHYEFSLITNFTFYYYFPISGDEFRQHDIRNMAGYRSTITKTQVTDHARFHTEAGMGIRTDFINPLELDHTERGAILGQLQYGMVRESNLYGYAEETIQSGPWLINAGVRYDYLHFYYNSLAIDSFATKIYSGLDPYAGKAIICPKLNVEYTFGPSFQLYLKSGKGFHSNDARVVIANQGFEILPACYGADLGLNWKPFSKLFVNTAIWYLYLQQEFTFGQDLINQPGGPVQPSGKTRRMGVDLSLRYQLTDWLYAWVNMNIADPRFIDSITGHRYLPLAPTFTSTGGLQVKFPGGWNGGISYRYLHNRAANSTYSLAALGYWVTDLNMNYTRKNYEIGMSIENLFNVTWNESQYEYISRLKYETAPVDEVSYTPGVPFFGKLKFTIFF